MSSETVTLMCWLTCGNRQTIKVYLSIGQNVLKGHLTRYHLCDL